MKKTAQMPPNAEEKMAPPVRDKKFVTVTWTFANIRSGPANDHSIVTSVNQGDKLLVIGESGEWLNVRLEDGKEGWISNRVVK
jgi:N-acetylmuramoyl-L-alanine amidase